jgi:hypothetical protein
MQRVLRGVCAVGMGVAVSSAGLPGAAAADGGMLRLAHLSPDTPAVDVYVDSVADPDAGITLTGVAYGTVSEYQDLAPGSYTVSMRSAGDPAEAPPVLSTLVEVTPDSARTVAGVGSFADLGLEVFEDDLQPPPAGRSRLRVIAAASSAPILDVSLPGADPVAADLAFPQTSGYLDVPAGRTALSVTPDGGTPTDLPVDLSAGAVYSVLVLDGESGGLTVRTVLDAASPGVVPVGGVATGAGGSAWSVAPGVAGGIAVVAALALLATGFSRQPASGQPARHEARRPARSAPRHAARPDDWLRTPPWA